MKKEVLLATNNEGKVERFKKQLKAAGLNIKLHTPNSLGIETIDVVEDGETLAQNAEKKVRAYVGKVDMPIIANDTGLYIEGEGFITAPKREALQGEEEHKLSKEQISEKLLNFWRNIAKKHGSKVDAEWREAFVLIDTDGTIKTSKSVREIILTDEVFGDPHIQLPIRCLYISKTTNKPAIQHTTEEEKLELKPVADALKELLV